jgi:WD40 repeat protein
MAKHIPSTEFPRIVRPNLVSYTLARSGQTGGISVSCIFGNRLLWRGERAHNGPITALAWSLDGELLASAGEDNMIHVWQAATGARLCSFEQHEGIQRLQWSSTGKLAASSGTIVRLWSVRYAHIRAAA